MGPTILFDGDCNFCDASVQFIIKRDPDAVFKFASLQSEIGQQLLKGFPEHQGVDSFLLVDREVVYDRSTAAFQVCRYLKGGWKIFYCLRYIPKPITDLFYQMVAKRRYKWFGKKVYCLLPTPDIRRRFLDME
ncbi:thiol-disulfide oxidoreductase DCC family protein [Virgibacillus soli]|uniref:DCC1-like thiol-disulfide oxidoreductase family protein n=1 Tax=Paracerasibacillus soli TaxID=480284 RepID=A0ABU5CVB2_9BACI|nr:DCC1-like thiol-disulfide oxidoreductase family protein [Virgibacillus soli]MDY0410317.1 DCC1-like thiol-disulfide oxidoreductase family protein [Virgibacillus soli]